MKLTQGFAVILLSLIVTGCNSGKKTEDSTDTKSGTSGTTQSPPPPGDKTGGPIGGSKITAEKLNDLQFVSKLTTAQIQSIPVEEISKLSSDALSFISKEQFKDLTDAQKMVLSYDQMKVIKDGVEKIATLPAHWVKNLKDDDISQLTNSFQIGLTQDHLRHLTPDQCKSIRSGFLSYRFKDIFAVFSDQQIKSLRSGVIDDLPTAFIPDRVIPLLRLDEYRFSWISDLSPSQRRMVTETQLQSFSNTTVVFLVKELSPDQVSKLKGEQILNLLTIDRTIGPDGAVYYFGKSNLSDQQHLAIKSDQLKGFTKKNAIQCLDVKRLSDDAIEGLSASQLADLSDAQVKALSSSQIKKFNTEQLKGLFGNRSLDPSKEQVDAVDVEKVPDDLKAKFVKNASAEWIKKLPADWFNTFSAKDMGELRLSNLHFLLPEHLKSLKADQVAGFPVRPSSAPAFSLSKYGFSKEQYEAFSVDALKKLSLSNLDDVGYTLMRDAFRPAVDDLNTKISTMTEDEISKIDSRVMWALGQQYPNTITIDLIQKFALQHLGIFRQDWWDPINTEDLAKHGTYVRALAHSNRNTELLKRKNGSP